MGSIAQAPYPACLFYSTAGALLGSFTFGYNAGVLNTALEVVSTDLKYDNDAVLSSAVVAGAAVGAIMAGKVADALGPRKAQMVNAIPVLLGAVLSAVSPGRHLGFLLGRLLAGFGAGAASLYTPRYIAEIAPTVMRGRLCSQNQVFINVGILAAYCAGIPYEHGFSSVWVGGAEVAWWRIMMLLVCITSLVQAILLLYCPESPVWLESQGEREAADVSCIRLWGSHAIVPDPDNEDTNLLLQAANSEAARLKEGWDALLAPRYRWMMAIALGLPLLQQASGINTVIYYSSLVFQRAGLSSPILGSIFMGLINVGVTLLAASLMDRWGRKPLLQLSFAGMAACLAGVAAVIYVPSSIQVQGMATVFLILLYVCCFALGCGPIPWVVLSEVLPSRIKGPAASLATAACWVGNLVVTLSFDAMLTHLGLGGSYLVYAVLNLIAVWFVTGIVVETKCRSLAEIEDMLLLPEDYSRVPLLVAHPPPHEAAGAAAAGAAGGISQPGGTGYKAPGPVWNAGGAAVVPADAATLLGLTAATHSRANMASNLPTVAPPPPVATPAQAAGGALAPPTAALAAAGRGTAAAAAAGGGVCQPSPRQGGREWPVPQATAADPGAGCTPADHVQIVVSQSGPQASSSSSKASRSGTVAAGVSLRRRSGSPSPPPRPPPTRSQSHKGPRQPVVPAAAPPVAQHQQQQQHHHHHHQQQQPNGVCSPPPPPPTTRQSSSPQLRPSVSASARGCRQDAAAGQALQQQQQQQGAGRSQSPVWVPSGRVRSSYTG